MKLYVDENVLIPRPETEELVNWVAETVKRRPARAARLLDIGTGSGCIAIALKKQFPSMAIQAVDISEGALQVAQKNAATHLSPIDFHHLDILSKESSKTLGKFDLIVSNPPYVTKGEASSMKKNVLQNEPHIALFVDDEDALKFYRAITEFACAHLNNNGTLFFEINEAMGEQVSEFLAHEGFSDVELKNDLQNKERMVKATYHS
jgi:release factor glutamine methyltransferase